MIKIRFFRM